MRLFMVGGSPYARVVRTLAAERGLAERIEIVTANPHEQPPELVALNPLSKVPTLVADDGFVHADSYAICLFLDTLGESPPLVMTGGKEKWAVTQRRVLAHGIMDCAVARRVESLKNPEPDRLRWMDRQFQATKRTLDRLEETADSFRSHVAIDTITLGCALGYLDFRFDADKWREGRPLLSAWYDVYRQRPAMLSSEYFEGPPIILG